MSAERWAASPALSVCGPLRSQLGSICASSAGYVGAVPLRSCLSWRYGSGPRSVVVDRSPFDAFPYGNYYLPATLVSGTNFISLGRTEKCMVCSTNRLMGAILNAVVTFRKTFRPIIVPWNISFGNETW